MSATSVSVKRPAVAAVAVRPARPASQQARSSTVGPSATVMFKCRRTAIKRHPQRGTLGVHLKVPEPRELISSIDQRAAHALRFDVGLALTLAP